MRIEALSAIYATFLVILLSGVPSCLAQPVRGLESPLQIQNWGQLGLSTDSANYLGEIQSDAATSDLQILTMPGLDLSPQSPLGLDGRLKMQANADFQNYNSDVLVIQNLPPNIDLTADQFRTLITDSALPVLTRPTPLFSLFPDLGPINCDACFDGPAGEPADLQLFQKNVQTVIQDIHLHPELRSIGGAPVLRPDKYPDSVMLFGEKPDGAPIVCSGVLVGPSTVITAAHCVCPQQYLSKVLIGTSFWSATQTIEIDKAQTKSLVSCAAFDSIDDFASQIGQGDLAIVHLVAPVADFKGRRIATDSMIKSAASVRSVSFGTTVPNDASGLRGKYVVDIIIASYDCSDVDKLFPNTGFRCQATREMIAAGAGRDTCGGDSGGPIYVLGNDLELYLAGITSRSVDPRGACGPGGIYVKLSDTTVQQWLQAAGVPNDLFAN